MAAYSSQNNIDTRDLPKLRLVNMDIEQRMGIPTGSMTHAGPILPLLIGVMATLILYGSLYFLLGGDGSHAIRRVAESLTGNPISYVIVFFVFWSLGILLVKVSKIKTQRAALKEKVLPEEAGFIIHKLNVDEVLDYLRCRCTDVEGFILTRRINQSLSNLKNIGNTSDVAAILQSQSYQDFEQVDSSYTFLRALLWSTPVLGFLGTVIGLSGAIGGFGSILSTEVQDVNAIRDGLIPITSNLSIAFETTLQGLAGILLLQMVLAAVRRKDEALLFDCTTYCQRYVLSRLRVSPENGLSADYPERNREAPRGAWNSPKGTH